MKKAFNLFLVVFLGLNQLAYSQGMLCADLFQEKYIGHEFERLKITPTADVAAETKLILSKGDFSTDLNKAALELQKMLMYNPAHAVDGKILGKDKLTLSMPIGEGYHLDILYISSGRHEGRFTIDRLELRSPNETVLTEIKKEKFLSPHGYDITAIEHVLSMLPQKGQTIELKLPLVLEDKLLERFDYFAQFFGYYSKDELRQMIRKMPIPLMLARFQVRRAVDRFIEVMVKQQLKNIPQYTMAILLATGIMNNGLINNWVDGGVKQQSYVEQSINSIQIPQKSPEIAAQLKEIRAHAKQIMKDKKAEYFGPQASEIVLDQNNGFSREHNTWIFEKSYNEGRQQKTYIVFSEEKAAQKGQVAIQYFIMEIDPIRYAELISFIKNEGFVFKK